MQSKLIPLTAISILLPLCTGAVQVAQAAELSTLFTTPAERQLINSNRYKNDEGVPVTVETEAIQEPLQQLVRKEVTREYKISGITVSSDGPHTVWINSLAYEDGEQLEDKSRIKVLVGDEIKVRITTPDGKKYYATSGEVVEVTFLEPIEKQE